MKQNDVCMYVCMYVYTIVSGRSDHSRKNAHPLLNYFSHRVKVYSGASFVWSLRSTVLCISEIRTSCNTVPKVTTRHFCIDGRR